MLALKSFKYSPWIGTSRLISKRHDATHNLGVFSPVHIASLLPNPAMTLPIGYSYDGQYPDTKNNRIPHFRLSLTILMAALEQQEEFKRNNTIRKNDVTL